MKCPNCETICIPENWDEPEINVGIGRFHCQKCQWSEPECSPAPKWCIVHIEHMERHDAARLVALGTCEIQRRELAAALAEAIRMAHPSTAGSYTDEAKRDRCAQFEVLLKGGRK